MTDPMSGQQLFLVSKAVDASDMGKMVDAASKSHGNHGSSSNSEDPTFKKRMKERMYRMKERMYRDLEVCRPPGQRGCSGWGVVTSLSEGSRRGSFGTRG